MAAAVHPRLVSDAVAAVAADHQAWCIGRTVAVGDAVIAGADQDLIAAGSAGIDGAFAGGAG